MSPISSPSNAIPWRCGLDRRGQACRGGSARFDKCANHSLTTGVLPMKLNTSNNQIEKHWETLILSSERPPICQIASKNTSSCSAFLKDIQNMGISESPPIFQIYLVRFSSPKKSLYCNLSCYFVFPQEIASGFLTLHRKSTGSMDPTKASDVAGWGTEGRIARIVQVSYLRPRNMLFFFVIWMCSDVVTHEIPRKTQ